MGSGERIRRDMIRENQRLFNQLHVISDGLLIYPMFPLAFWIRFYVLGAESSIPLVNYMRLGVFYTVFQLLTFALFGLYQSYRTRKLRLEIRRVVAAVLTDMILLVTALYIGHDMHYSRLTLAIFIVLTTTALSVKRYVLRRTLRWIRGKDLNQKHVLVLGGGMVARRYIEEIHRSQDYGYRAVGYVAEKPSADMEGVSYLGDFDVLEELI